MAPRASAATQTGSLRAAPGVMNQNHFVSPQDMKWVRNPG